MTPINKLTEKGKRIVKCYVNNIGKKNYKKLLEENLEEYGFPVPNPHDEREIDSILKITMQRKANIYKDKEIPLKYIDNYVRQEYPDSKASNKFTLGITDSHFNPPQTKYFKPILNYPVAHMRNAIGHEIGHAKSRIELNDKIDKINQKYQNKPNKKQKLIDKLNDKHNKSTEAKADKNISAYLKQMGLSKKDRRAHYYLQKNIGDIYNITNNRYGGKFGNLKYIKDYVFGFSHPCNTYFSNVPRLYHVSDKGDLKSLQPRIPNNYFTTNNYEENTTPRCSFSTSIYGCLRGLSDNLKNKKLYVYVPIGDYKVVSPNRSQVADVKYTNEKWILEPVKIKCIGVILVTHAQINHPLVYKYGKHKATLYGWNYKWLQKFN